MGTSMQRLDGLSTTWQHVTFLHRRVWWSSRQWRIFNSKQKLDGGSNSKVPTPWSGINWRSILFACSKWAECIHAIQLRSIIILGWSSVSWSDGWVLEFRCIENSGDNKQVVGQCNWIAAVWKDASARNLFWEFFSSTRECSRVVYNSNRISQAMGISPKRNLSWCSVPEGV